MKIDRLRARARFVRAYVPQGDFMKKLLASLITKLKDETYIFVLAVMILIATLVAFNSCTHFSMRIGELKDAEVVLDNTGKE